MALLNESASASLADHWGIRWREGCYRVTRTELNGDSRVRIERPHRHPISRGHERDERVVPPYGEVPGSTSAHDKSDSNSSCTDLPDGSSAMASRLAE